MGVPVLLAVLALALAAIEPLATIAVPRDSACKGKEGGWGLEMCTKVVSGACKNECPRVCLTLFDV